jgi:low affinity Fe/Cu permease
MEDIQTKLEEIIKRLEQLEATNKEQQLTITKLTKNLDEIVQMKNDMDNRLDKETVVTKMNTWKSKYSLDSQLEQK